MVNSRRIYLNVTGESCIDYVDIVKNGQILARMNGPLTPIAPEGDTARCKVKVDFGWNREEKIRTLAGQTVSRQRTDP